MPNLDNPESKKGRESPEAKLPTPPIPADVENQTQVLGMGGILRRWRREDFMKKGSLALRGLGLLFSLFAFIIMASNKHGDWKDFDKYEEYRYVLAIAILSTFYTAEQVLRQVHEFCTGRDLFSKWSWVLLDFVGDQICAYLLISAASTAIPLTNRMREGIDNIFTDSSAAAISMEFLAFFALASSSIISGYKLSKHSYI
ncbi:hypothetical protein LguiA_016451 [Lonicera macranthoides]